MGMCAMAGKKAMRGYVDGGEIDPEMQRQIEANKAKFNPPPKQSLFSGIFGSKEPKQPAAPAAQPTQPQSLVGTIQNRNEELRKAANYANGGLIGMAIDAIKNRQAQNIEARNDDPQAVPQYINYDRARERESDADLARKMKAPQEQQQKPGYANGGKIKGPGTPTSDSIPAEVKQTGEPIKVSTGERILSKKQDMFLQKIAHGAGFDSLDAMLEHGTGTPVGPTMKGGMAHAATGADPTDMANGVTGRTDRFDTYGNNLATSDAMKANPMAFGSREPGMAGTNIYDNGAGTSTGLSGSVNFTSSDPSRIAAPTAVQGQQQGQPQAIAEPATTGIQSMADKARAAGIDPNGTYRPGQVGDPYASNLNPQQQIAQNKYFAPKQGAQLANPMTSVDEMFPSRRRRGGMAAFAGGGEVGRSVTLPNGRVIPLTPMVKQAENPVDLNAGYTQNPDAVTLGGNAAQNKNTIVVPAAVDMNAYTPEPGFNPLVATTGMLADSAAAARGQGSYEELRAKRPDSIGQKPQSVMSQASYSNEAKAPVAIQGINQGSQEARIAELAKQSAQAAAATTGFVGQQVNNTGSVSGRSNVDATKLQAPNGGGFITNAQGKAMFLPPASTPTVRDPNGQYDANGNNMARTNQMKAELAGMERDRLMRDMGADITSPGTRLAAQQQIAALDQGQGMAMQANKAQRDDVTAGLDQQSKRNTLAEYANLQKAIDEYSKMPAGPERDAAMEAIAARQGRNLPDRSQLMHAAGGSDPTDPMGQRRLPDRVYLKDQFNNVREVTGQQQAAIKAPSYEDYAKQMRAKNTGITDEQIKAGYAKNFGSK